MEDRVNEPGQRHDDDYLTATELGYHLPGSPTPETVRNWMKSGFRYFHSGAEHVVRLRYTRPGNIYYTTFAWVREFEESRRQHQALVRAENGSDE